MIEQHIRESKWYMWTAWEECPVTRGSGTQWRNRVCNRREFTPECRGHHTEPRPCHVHHCTGNANIVQRTRVFVLQSIVQYRLFVILTKGQSFILKCVLNAERLKCRYFDVCNVNK